MHIVKHSDQIATITKENAKLNATSNVNADTKAKPEKGRSQSEGMKCDQNIIRENRVLLGHIEKIVQRDSELNDTCVSVPNTNAVRSSGMVTMS